MQESFTRLVVLPHAKRAERIVAQVTAIVVISPVTYRRSRSASSPAAHEGDTWRAVVTLPGRLYLLTVGLQCLPDVLQQEHEVQFVGGAGLELGDEV